MKKIFSLFAVAALATTFFAFTSNDPETLAIGAKAPKADVKMEDISGKKYSLNDLKKDNGLLVVFSCNTCPFVVGNEERKSEGWDRRYAEIQKYADENKIGMVLVNSNEAKRKEGDSMADMKKHAKERGFGTSKYVLDKNSEVANAFFARTTPHVYLFDKDMKLVYKGAIDDNAGNSKEVKEAYLKNAITEVAQGKKVTNQETKPVGCSIKRVS
jgi:thioredoxin-related protein